MREGSYHICTKHYRVVLEYIHFIYKHCAHDNPFILYTLSVCLYDLYFSLSLYVLFRSCVRVLFFAYYVFYIRTMNHIRVCDHVNKHSC